MATTRKAVPAKRATVEKAVAPKVEKLPYDLDQYRDLKRRGTDALTALMYDARLKAPKGSRTPEEGASKVAAAIAAYGEWVKLLEQQAKPLEKKPSK